MAVLGLAALIALAPCIGIACWAICRAGDRPTPRPGTLDQAAEEGQ